MPLPQALTGNDWTQKIARHILPWLIWAAQHRRTVYYSRLDEEVVRQQIHNSVIDVMYGHPAGTVGNALIEIEAAVGIEIPPLNALVINKRENVPGKGVGYYVNRIIGRDVDYENMNISDKKIIIDEIQKRVFDFTQWSIVTDYLNDVTISYPELRQISNELSIKFDESFGVASYYSGSITTKPPTKDDIIDTAGYGGGEFYNHKRLKIYISENPCDIGLPARAVRCMELEYPFWSGDRVDILFSYDNYFVAVEIKSEISSDADVYRGLHQCVKYMSLLKAEQIINGNVPNGIAILVVARPIPDSVKEHSDILNVKVIVVRPR